MVRMADRNRQRIGRVGTRDLCTGKQGAQHRLYLLFRRAAGADDRFLDQPRRIFGDREPAARAAQQDDAAHPGP